ncbi:MAG: hypothetical protein ABH858_04375 [Candidatus Omnitrophota bacterium]
MAKKTAFIVFIFFTSLLYLHQKVAIYREAYKLQESYHRYDKLVDCRDLLMYNRSERISLAKINSWIEANGFNLVDSDKVLALNIESSPVREDNKPKNNQLVAYFDRIFRLSFASRAIAQEQQ